MAVVVNICMEEAQTSTLGLDASKVLLSFLEPKHLKFYVNLVILSIGLFLLLSVENFISILFMVWFVLSCISAQMFNYAINEEMQITRHHYFDFSASKYFKKASKLYNCSFALFSRVKGLTDGGEWGLDSRTQFNFACLPKQQWRTPKRYPWLRVGGIFSLSLSLSLSLSQFC
ncbi:hypothetical protein ACSBR1_037567 [Camellia fascicularis]